MKQIGQILRQRREAKKLSLATVNLKTHITIKYLNALEEGNISVFPAEVYFLGSLRHYAKFLGLDAEQLVEIFRAQKKESEKEEVRPAERKPKPFVPVVALSALVAVIVLGLLAVVLWQGRQQSALPQPQEPMSVEVPMVSTQTPVVVVPKQETMTLTVTAHRPSWVRVLSDGALSFEGTLAESQERTWTARSRFHIVVGYAPGLDVRLNGTMINVMAGAVKDVNELDLTWKDVRRDLRLKPDSGAKQSSAPALKGSPGTGKAPAENNGASPAAALKQNSATKPVNGARPNRDVRANIVPGQDNAYKVNTGTRPYSAAKEKSDLLPENSAQPGNPQ
ncbi:MAG: helix-turn-helix domain-containing protein [Endomicrobiales bacterium]